MANSSAHRTAGLVSASVVQLVRGYIWKSQCEDFLVLGEWDFPTVPLKISCASPTLSFSSFLIQETFHVVRIAGRLTSRDGIEEEYLFTEKGEK